MANESDTDKEKLVNLHGLETFKSYADSYYTPKENLDATIDASVETCVNSKIDELDVTDSAVDGQYVDSVSQSNGKITVHRSDLPSSGGSGTSLYLHSVELYDADKSIRIYAMCFNNSSDKLSSNALLAQWLYDNGYYDSPRTENSYTYPCTGIYGDYYIYAMYSSSNGSSIYVNYRNSDTGVTTSTTTSTTTFGQDRVMQLL